MWNDIGKETSVLNYVIPRHPCTTPLSNSILDGTFRDNNWSTSETGLRDGHARRLIAMCSPVSAWKTIWAALRLNGTEISLSTVLRP